MHCLIKLLHLTLKLILSIIFPNQIHSTWSYSLLISHSSHRVQLHHTYRYSIIILFFPTCEAKTRSTGNAMQEKGSESAIFQIQKLEPNPTFYSNILFRSRSAVHQRETKTYSWSTAIDLDNFFDYNLSFKLVQSISNVNIIPIKSTFT